MQISSCCRERENLRLRREYASRGQARPVKPRAHRPDRDIERESDLLVAEVGEGVEEQCIPLSRAHRRESTCQPSVESGTVDSRSRLVLSRRPIGRRRCDRTPVAGAALPANCGEGGWSRSRTATAERCRWHGSSLAARTRARTSPQPARQRDHVRHVDGDTCGPSRSGARRSTRTLSARSASAPRNPCPTEQAPSR